MFRKWRHVEMEEVPGAWDSADLHAAADTPDGLVQKISFNDYLEIGILTEDNQTDKRDRSDRQIRQDKRPERTIEPTGQ